MKRKWKFHKGNQTKSARMKRLYLFADELIESTKINAWEYGNTGNFIYN